MIYLINWRAESVSENVKKNVSSDELKFKKALKSNITNNAEKIIQQRVAIEDFDIFIL